MRKYTQILEQQSRAIELGFILVAVAGIMAFLSLPSNVYPELSFPRIVIIAHCKDMAPDRVVLAVTRPLEQAASQVYNVRWIKSKSIRGAAQLFVEFQPHADMQLGLQQLQARLSEVRGSLPSETDLLVERVTPAIFPVIAYNVWSPTLTLADLRTIVEYQVIPWLTRADGVARVDMQGGETRELEVKVDPTKLEYYRLSMADIASAIKNTNLVQVVGKFDSSYQQNLIVASGESTTPQQLAQTVVARRTDAPVLLSDLASVAWGIADVTQIVSVSGRPGVVINIYRQPNSNVVAVDKSVAERLHKLIPTLPPGAVFQRSYDESQLVVDAINNVRDSILTGILLIIVVLFLFLREWRATVIAAISIPLSAAAAFGVLYLINQSLNLMSLGGIAVAMGLVIDDAVVVVENIDHQLRKGLTPFDAVTEALTELIAPVVSSTVTTVVVFLPLGLLSGVAGQFFISFTITLAIAVCFSLVLSLTLTPMLAAHWLPRREATTAGEVNPHYRWLLDRVLHRQTLAFALVALLIVGAAVIGSHLGSDFLPHMDEGSFVFDYETPPGTSLAETDAVARKLEASLARDPDIVSWTRRTGAENGLYATELNKGDITVVLRRHGRKRSVFQIIEEQRKIADKEVPQADTDFHQILEDQLNDLSGVTSPIEVKVFGTNAAELRKLTREVKNKITPVAGLVDVIRTGKAGAPETIIRVNMEVANRLGLTPANVAAQVHNAMLGGIASQVKQHQWLVNVRVRFINSVRFNPDNLPRLPIFAPNGLSVPLAGIAKLVPGAGEPAIRQENQQQYDSVEANVQGRDLGSVVSDVKHRIASLHLPPGYLANIGGIAATQKKAFQQILAILALDVLLVYLVLLVQFRSWKQPFTIILAIPPAMFGVVAGLAIAGIPWNVSSLMGVVLLVGLVVKNGIILLDFTNRLRHHDQMPMEEALVHAGSLRLRPILMTTLCTVLGLFPLALGLGAGAALQQPLAVAVIGGLSLSTLFTLVLMPLIYNLLERGWRRRRRPYK